MDKRKKKHLVYLSLGANLGNKTLNLTNALNLLNREAGVITKYSSIYKTAAWNMEATTPDFYNLVAELETSLLPAELLKVTQNIEKEIGRTEKSVNGKYENRLIDIDILFYDDLKMQTENLTIPHPLLHKRNFVLYPLQEIAGSKIHPFFNKTVNQLKAESKDTTQIIIIKD